MGLGRAQGAGPDHLGARGKARALGALRRWEVLERRAERAEDRPTHADTVESSKWDAPKLLMVDLTTNIRPK